MEKKELLALGNRAAKAARMYIYLIFLGVSQRFCLMKDRFISIRVVVGI